MFDFPFFFGKVYLGQWGTIQDCPCYTNETLDNKCTTDFFLKYQFEGPVLYPFSDHYFLIPESSGAAFTIS